MSERTPEPDPTEQPSAHDATPEPPAGGLHPEAAEPAAADDVAGELAGTPFVRDAAGAGDASSAPAVSPPVHDTAEQAPADEAEPHPHDLTTEFAQRTHDIGSAPDPQPTRSLEAIQRPDREREPEPPSETDFAVVLRGYERRAVDAYVARVTAHVDELEATKSPAAAVRRALERVGSDTARILGEAQETVDQMTARSRAEADDRLQRSLREAAEVRSAAEAHVRALDADNDRLWQERQKLIEDARALSAQLAAIADDAEQRFPPEPILPLDATPAPAAEDRPYDADLVGDDLAAETHGEGALSADSLPLNDDPPADGLPPKPRADR